MHDHYHLSNGLTGTNGSLPLQFDQNKAPHAVSTPDFSTDATSAPTGPTMHSDLFETPANATLNEPHVLDEAASHGPHVTMRQEAVEQFGGSGKMLSEVVVPHATQSSHGQTIMMPSPTLSLPQPSQLHAPGGSNDLDMGTKAGMNKDVVILATHANPLAHQPLHSDGSHRTHSMQTQAVDGIFKPKKRLMATCYPLSLAL